MHTGRPPFDVSADLLKAYREQRLRALEHQVRLMAGAAQMGNPFASFGCRPGGQLMQSAGTVYPRPPQLDGFRPSLHHATNHESGARHSVPYDSATPLENERASSYHDRDAANRLLSLSPLASPALTASVDVLATPELMSIALGEDNPQRLPQPLQLPVSQFTDEDAAHEPRLPEYTDVSLTPTTEEFLDEEALLGIPKKWSEHVQVEQPAVSHTLSSCMKRTGSMLQMSHTLVSMANTKRKADDVDDDSVCRSAKLPRRQSLTCLDMLSEL